METEKARIFLSVMNEGSLSAAAEQLGYTTSGISRSIASLEEETGVTLFNRGKKGVEITAEAEMFVPIMRELVHQAEMLQDTASRIRGLEQGTLMIGISYAGYFQLVAEELKRFSDQHPGIRIKTWQGTSTQLLRAIEHHEIDLAIMTYRESDYHFLKLISDPMVACLPANHPKANDALYPLKDFEVDPFIIPFPGQDTDCRRALKKCGIHPNIQFSTMDVYDAYCMVEAGFGSTYMNRLEVASLNSNIRIMRTKPEVTFDIGVMYPDSANLTHAAREFLETLES